MSARQTNEGKAEKIEKNEQRSELNNLGVGFRLFSLMHAFTPMPNVIGYVCVSVWECAAHK